MKKLIAVLISILSVVLCFSSCADNNDEVTVNTDTTDIDYTDKLTNPENPVATIKMKDGGVIVAELFYDNAPNTVLNFISLANKGFYDGLIFHRVVPGFVIQGGDPNGNGTGGPGYAIFGEFPNNDFDNELKHGKGYLSMARKGSYTDPASAYNTAGSQFFIAVAECPSLDGDYAVFGYCFEGMDVVDEIVKVKTDNNDKPLEDVVIESIRVNCGDKTYDEPEKIM